MKALFLLCQKINSFCLLNLIISTRQVGGAAKNVIAVAAGMSEGLGLGP